MSRWLCFYCRRKNEENKRKCVYCGEKKVGSKEQLEKKLDKVFSKFIRARDKYRCVTCGGQGNEAGHYEKRNYRSTRWDERNVHCQCTRCNRYLGGNLTAYAVYIKKKYGAEILEELHSKSREIWKPSRQELMDLIEKYEQKIKEGNGHI